MLLFFSSSHFRNVLGFCRNAYIISGASSQSILVLLFPWGLALEVGPEWDILTNRGPYIFRFVLTSSLIERIETMWDNYTGSGLKSVRQLPTTYPLFGKLLDEIQCWWVQNGAYWILKIINIFLSPLLKYIWDILYSTLEMPAEHTRDAKKQTQH